MNRRHLVTGALALLILVSVIGAGVAFAQQQATDSSDSEEYSINELRQDGQHYSVDSARIVSSEGQVYWLEHRRTNQPWDTVSKDSPGQKLAEDGTLMTNSVYLRTIRASSEPRTMNVTLVYWNAETREVTQNNTTTTQTYAADQRVVHKTVTLEPGWSLAEIELPQHDNATQVTMWLDDHPETARWTFQHESIAVQKTIPIDNWSGFLVYGAAFIIVPALAMNWYGSRKVKEWIDKAGAPPGHGFAYYFIVITVLAGITLYVAYTEVAEVIVTLPPILGVYVGLVSTGYTLASHEGKADKTMLLQPHIEDVEEFTRSKIPDIGAGNADGAISFSEDLPLTQWDTFQILDEGSTGLSIIRDGKLAFLARLKGGRARIRNTDQLKTRTSCINSPTGEIIFVDPDADTLIDYKPPGLSLKTPEVDDWKDLVWPVGLLGGGAALAWQAAQTYGPAAWAILLLALPVLVWKFAVTGTDSYCEVNPAPVHLRPVLATMLAGTVGVRDAKRLEEAEKGLWAALAGNEQEARKRVDDRDSTIIEEMFGPDTTVDDGDLTDDEDESAVGDSPEQPPVDRIAGGDDDD